MTTRILIALLLLTLTLPLFAAEAYQVVVNASNPIASISKSTIRGFFLGKATRWPDGSAVKPIDLPETSSIRAQFSKTALGKEIAAVKSHWLNIVFAGRGTPPVQLDSDEKVLAAVRSSAAAIGYVASSTSVGNGVKAIPVTD